MAVSLKYTKVFLVSLTLAASVLLVGGATIAQTESQKPVSQWTPKDYEQAFSQIEADHNSSSATIRSRVDKAVARSLNSLPVSGINSQAAADLVLKGSTGTITTTVMQVRRADGTQVQLLLKNGVKLAEGAQFFYSKNSDGDLTAVVVPHFFRWHSQYWCFGPENCNYSLWRNYRYYKYTYSTSGGSSKSPQFGISYGATIPEARFHCTSRRNTDLCIVDSLIPVDANKTYSVSGRSYEGDSYGPQIKLVDNLPWPRQIHEEIGEKYGYFPVTQATQINSVESVSDYTPRRGDNFLYRSQVRKFMESMCSDPNYGHRLVGCISPPPSDPDDDGQAGKAPLILVPGIAGSKLEYAEDVPQYDSNGAQIGYEHSAGDEKWPQITDTALGPFDEHLKDLRLAPNGEQPYSDEPKHATEVGDIWREEPLPFPLENKDEYKTTIETLTSEYGYAEGETLFVLPYDWRKDIGANTGSITQSDKLLEKIEEVRNETGVEKVNILAHSQGGLVALAALRDPASRGKVDKVMTLGTPVLGATKSLAVFDEQACFGAPGPSLDGCAIYSGTARTLFQNFPGAYQLFPSRAFHKAEGSPVRVASDSQAGPGTPSTEYDYEVKELSYEEWSSEIKENGNASLIDEADTFHNRYDDIASKPLADPSVELMRVVGDGFATPDHILQANRFCGGNGPCSYTELRYTDDNESEGGDGTVPLHSADLHNPETGFDLRGGVENHYENVEHGELQKSPRVLGQASSFFDEDSQEEPSQQASAEDVQPSAMALMDFLKIKSAQAQNEVEQNSDSRLRTQPISFGGVELQTIGSVQGRVEDTGGNVLGALPDQERGELPRGFIVEEIDGGDYSRIGDDPTQSFFLNESGTYTGTLTIEEQDDVEIRVRTYEEGKTTGTAIFYLNRLIGGKLPQGAMIQLGFRSGGDLNTLRLQIDEDADGTIDWRLAPYSVIMGTQASDQTPPTTTAITRVVEPERGSRPRPTKARVALKAQDGPEGSGIGAIYYRLEGEQRLRLYEEPFTVPLNTSIHYGAVDKAGNASPLQKLLVDDAPNNLRTAEPIKPKDKIRRHIDPKGDVDWFVFEADGVSTYTVQLHGLPADYDLGIYDQRGKEVAASPRRKKKTEKVSIKPSVGSYYVRVVGHEGDWSEKLPYHLKVDNRSGGRQDNG